MANKARTFSWNQRGSFNFGQSVSRMVGVFARQVLRVEFGMQHYKAVQDATKALPSALDESIAQKKRSGVR